MLRLFLFISSSIICGLVSAANVAAPAADIPSRTGHYYINYVLNDDGTSVESREWSTTVLKPAAIDWVKHVSISYSTSVQKTEIIEAYTKKADGRRIDVPKDNYQLNINKGREKDGPVFSDRSSVSLVFPDVTVGDTTVISYRIIQTEAIFPKHFSVNETFSKQAAFDDVRVRFEYPSALWAQYQTRDMKESLSSPAPGRKLVEWTYANPQPTKSDRRDFSVYDPDQESGYSFSTFKNYAEIAAAYGQRALPKATVTEQVKKLADDIVANTVDQKEQARLLYEWVATKITYGGNCVGVGTVVPHDLPFVLENKMGDCKDHATLLQALLAARGIESRQALINAGSIYKLPKIPVVANINHVINYLPAFDLFVDSTSNSTPFGTLPAQDRGKPVLLVNDDREGALTPTPKRASEHKTVSNMKIAADGSLSGTVEVFLKGDPAAGVREWARNLTSNTEEDFVKDSFRSMGLAATGKLMKDNAAALTDTYHYKIVIEKAEKYLKLFGGGAFYIYPILGGASIQSVVPSGLDQEFKTDTACTNGVIVEEYVIELPKAMKVLSVPHNFKAGNKLQSYQANYALKGNVLTIKRHFEDRTPTNVCTPEIIAEYGKLGEKISDNLKTAVLFR